MEIWSEFVADHDTKLGSYKLSFNTLVLAWLLANLTISVTKFSIKGRILYKNVCVFEDASCLLHNKTPFTWSRVPQTTLPPSYPGRTNFSLISFKKFSRPFK